MKNEILFIWASSNMSTRSNHVNAPYHFVHLGEVMDYVERKCEVMVDYLDMEAQNIDYTDVMKK